MGETEKRKPLPGKKEQILEAATSIFLDRDYSRVRMEEIAEAAGVGKGTVYEYFKNKEDLFMACITSKTMSLMNLYAENACRSGNALQDLRHLLYSQHRFIFENWRWIRLLFNERPMQLHDLEKWMLKQRRAVLKVTEGVIRRGIAERVLRDDLDTGLAARCFTAVQFVALGGMMVLDGEEVSDDTLESLLGIFIQGVGAHD